MSDLSNKELTKIAKLSGMTLTEDEIQEFAKQLKQVLDYTEEITKLVPGVEVEATRSVNVFREDKAVHRDSKNIISMSPKHKKTYFVVPRVLD